VKVTLVFWIAVTHVELDFLHITFNRILLYRNTFELADFVLRPYCCHLSEDCDDFTFGDARVRDELALMVLLEWTIYGFSGEKKLGLPASQSKTWLADRSFWQSWVEENEPQHIPPAKCIKWVHERRASVGQ